ncbi:MAG: type II toxin-antitoxin system death-on-curing family toxin [Patescibacteria group bacterium]
MRYIDIGEVVVIHVRMLSIGGGKGGVRDFTLLHSAVERPKASFGGRLLYKNIWFQSAALLHSLVKNHAFTDGNKRTAYFTTMRFLFINGYNLKPPKPEIIRFTLLVDNKKTIELTEISKWLRKHSVKIKLPK